MRELSACLALTAASGMNDDAPREWLITARATLNGIPADLLTRGCRVARTYCDHPSKIVPTIMREVETAWNNRKMDGRPDTRGFDNEARSIGEIVTPAQIEEIKAEFGLVTNPYPDEPKPVRGAPRKPTREDYIALGVSPDVLDRLEAPKEAA